MLSTQGRWAEALQLDAVIVAEHGETPELRLRIAISALEAGRPDEAEPVIARAIAAGDDSLSMVLTEGRAAVVRGDARRALACADRVLEAVNDVADLDARLNALDLEARARDFLGDRAGAEAAWARQADEAAASGRTQAQLRAIVQLGKIELFAGRPPQQLYAAVELARAAGALVELSWAEENLAICLGVQGDVEASKAVLADAIARCRELRLDQLAYLLVSHAVDRRATRTESVDDILDEAEALAPTADLRLHSTSMRAPTSRCDAAGTPKRSSSSRRCVELMRAMPGVVPLDAPCWFVWALAADGRRDDAVAALEEARALPDLARWYGRPVVLAAAEALLAGDASRRRRRHRGRARPDADGHRADAHAREPRSCRDRNEPAGSAKRWTPTRRRAPRWKSIGSANSCGRPEVPSPGGGAPREMCPTGSPAKG